MKVEVIGNATLYQGDAREILPYLATRQERAKALVTDAPYKVTSGGHTSLLGGWIGSEEYGNSGSPVECDLDWPDWLPMIPGVLEPDAHLYLFSNDRNLQDARAAAEAAGFYFHRLLVWDKRSAAPNRWYQQTCEFVLFMKQGKAYRIANPSTKSLVSLFQRDESEHPTEKPVDLCQVYIENSTKPGDLVLDPFVGSGTTGVAALRSGRRFIGIELTERWFEVACERLACALDQVREPVAIAAPTGADQGGFAL